MRNALHFTSLGVRQRLCACCCCPCRCRDGFGWEGDENAALNKSEPFGPGHYRDPRSTLAWLVITSRSRTAAKSAIRLTGTRRSAAAHGGFGGARRFVRRVIRHANCPLEAVSPRPGRPARRRSAGRADSGSVLRGGRKGHLFAWRGLSSLPALPGRDSGGPL